ncbi:hemin ABC transporter substrate-binding protein [Paracoccus sp. (in: a-proteobacteria)]|uniref:heme/hemin ABC transporter substrate-binding protein n=1 Tax=Paracoccus sp. TaxID=267 RepID=UPI0026DF70D2|nr:ABC transporter substrate-binding protein [Paracoccus sp. (in: a-proteobacteria)]MDO5647166.1 ABC transporter substrate-binding protein [Paracoccus sp. (in: a-proteobacteria)]
MIRPLSLSLTLAMLLAGPVAADGQRVVAIGGAVTEIVFALGLHDRLVARDTTSQWPDAAVALPDVGYIRRLSPEGVLSMRPDLILAEDGAGPPEAVALLKSAGVPFQTIPAGETADAALAKVQAVAAALGADPAPVLAPLRADLDRAADAAASTAATPRRVLFVLGVQGGRIMASGTGTAADQMIRLAGAQNAITGYQGYKPLTDEAIIAAAPDAIVLMDRGDGSTDFAARQAQIIAMPAIATTPAARQGRVIQMNGLYLLGFGPRTGAAALDLHRALYGGA